MRVQYGKSENVEKFLNSFTISSAFPFWKESYFLPKPQGKINVRVKGREEHEYRKKLKKVKFIESSLWQEIIKGITVTVDDDQLQKDFLIKDSKDCSDIYKSRVMQRVSVPRCDGQHTVPFFFDWKFFDSQSGLYCLTDATGDLLDEIIQLFKLLGENGIGTDKNVGGGKFNVAYKKNFSLNFPDNANAEMLLSVYIPTEQELPELHLSESKYGLILRGGYIAGSQEESFRHLLKKSIYMFGVGSTFTSSKPLQGKVVDLKPKWNDERMHPVYRSGRPFYVPIKIEKP
jgi:CRISPR-associated protein Csm4